MNESITSRVARLMSGSVNALVDAVENASPELVMEQAIREVDSAIADTQAELGQQIAQKHLASKKLIEEKPDLTLKEIKAALAAKKIKVGVTAIFRFLESIGLNYKKNGTRQRTKQT